jgi:hypothetical protein
MTRSGGIALFGHFFTFEREHHHSLYCTYTFSKVKLGLGLGNKFMNNRIQKLNTIRFLRPLVLGVYIHFLIIRHKSFLHKIQEEALRFHQQYNKRPKNKSQGLLYFANIKDLDVDAEVTDLAIISMNSQLQHLDIPKHLHAIEATNNNESAIM